MKRKREGIRNGTIIQETGTVLDSSDGESDGEDDDGEDIIGDPCEVIAGEDAEVNAVDLEQSPNLLKR